MPRNGSGTYTLYPGVNPVVTGTTITSSWANNTLSDIQSALTASISNDGQTPITADLPMTGFKHTNVGNAAARNSYAAAGQVQDSTFTWGGTAGGTSDALTLTLTPAITAYAAGQVFRFISGASANTTTTPTLNISGVGAVTLKRADGTALAIGDIKAGTRYEAEHDGTNFRLRALIASPALGGTGVNNGTFTITLGGNISTAAAFTTSGANALTLTTTGATNVTLPTSGTLLSDAAAVTVPQGGTGRTSLTNHGLLVGAGASAVTQLAAAAAGTLLTGQGASADPAFSATPTLGVAGTTLGTITLAGNTSGTVTIQPQAAAGTYNFNLPTSAGTSGQPLLSAGGGSSPMTFGTLGPAAGGTGVTSLTANNVILGNGTSAVQFVAPGTSGNVLTSNGTTWTSAAASSAGADVQVFTSSGTWTKPSGKNSAYIICIGGGGGGGSGRKGAAGSVRCGGGGGGGGAIAVYTFPTSILGSTETVTIGAGGAGGASQSTNSTDGNVGTTGGTTSFGGWLRANGGTGANGGSASAGAGGGGANGHPAVNGFSGVTGASASTTGGAGNNASPGSGSGAATGGGSGGGLTSGDAESAGGSGGTVGSTATASGYNTNITGGTGGSAHTAGGNGNNSGANYPIGGAGGGGGGSSNTAANVGNGGNGGLYGGGGGGGGAGTDAVVNSGAGGTGGNGICIVISF